jgi:hypothetical protein
MGTEIADIERAALAGNPTWALVQRISASACFQNTPRLRELLLYICERALLNRPDDLREQLIGYRVFLRKPDYSPGDDNIVRVEVRRLRNRLSEYFTAEGREEPFVVTIPKGSYVPVFQPREPAVVVEPLPAPMETIPADPALHEPGRRWYRIVAAIAVAIALAGVGFWAGQWRAARAVAGPAAERSPLWSALFNRDQPTLIVCADSLLVLAQVLRRGPIPLEEYAKGDYTSGAGPLDADTKKIFGMLSGWTWTNFADIRVVDRLHRVNTTSWDRVSIRTARITQIHDFTSGNAVVLGSIQSNPWNSLFKQHLNFQIDWAEQTRTASVRNVSPLREEQSIYLPAAPDDSTVYSTIAFIPNLRHNGSVLIVAGITGQGTEAAGEYITNPATNSRLMRMITGRAGGELPYFEVLLKSHTVAGVAQDAEVVALRVRPSGQKAR